MYSENIYGFGKLWVALMYTARRPSPLYKTRKTIDLYGEHASTDDDPPPRNLETVALQYKAMHQFVWKNTQDPDDIGWKKGCTGWYIEEDHIKNFLMYFDDLMAWRKEYHDDEFEKIGGDNISIVIHMQSNATFDLVLHQEKDELQCAFEILEEDVMTTSPFELPPPHFPSRIVVLTFELLGPKKAHAVFSGNTKPFQMNFVRREIKGAVKKINSTDAYGEYYRVKEYISLEDEMKCVGVLRDLFENCLLSSPVVVRLKSTHHDKEQLQKIMANFKSASNIRIEL